MMPTSLPHDLRGLKIIQSSTVAARHLYDTGLASGSLTTLDCFTVRDLLASPCEDADTLEVLLLLLFMRLNSGSSCLSFQPDDLLGQWEVHGLADASNGGTDFVDAVHRALKKDAWTGLLGAASLVDDAWQTTYLPLVRFRRDDQDLLYFHRYFQAERRVERQLARRIMSADDDCSLAPEALATTLAEVLGADPTRPNPEQRRAVGLAMLKPFLVLSGGPGTGKTSTIVSILRCLVRSGVAVADIALAAPTGRAAYRLSEAIQLELTRLIAPSEADLTLRDLHSKTLHRLLRYNPSRNEWLHHAGRPLSAKVLIVDEVSMIDIVLMGQLLAATTPGTKIILVGDQHQLPSVEAGAVLAGLLPQAALNVCSSATASALQASGIEPPLVSSGAGSLAENCVRLIHSHRGTGQLQRFAQTTAPDDLRLLLDESPPLTFNPEVAPPPNADATDLALGLTLNFAFVPGDLRRILPALESAAQLWQETIKQWCHWHFLTERDGASYAALLGEVARCRAADVNHENELLKTIAAYSDGMKILTLVRRGAYGCDTANRILGRMMQRDLSSTNSPQPLKQGEGFAGMPLMITQNDYVNELFNGDTGFVVRCRDDDWRVVFRRGNSFSHFALESLGAWTAAWASTVHKSQGSEYDRVLIGLPCGLAETSPASRLLTREILYTGITRAREFALVFGDDKTLAQCLARTTSRQSGLRV